MKPMRMEWALLFTWAVFNGTGLAQAAERHLNFVDCPIIRDTKTVPCWLAEHEGELYYLGVQQDQGAEFHPPYLGHRVLVEGVVSDEPRICGGIVLKPVHTSNLPELDPACNTTMLPAQDQYTVPFAFRDPKPGLGRRFGPPPPPTKAGGKTTFTVYYDFDVDWANRWTPVLSEAAALAKADKAAKVEAVAYRAAIKLSDGQTLVERPDIARRRAQRLEQTLRNLGLPANAIKVTWRDEPLPGDGLEDFKLRKADIIVTPGVAAVASAGNSSDSR
jgi:hypothetical protein